MTMVAITGMKDLNGNTKYFMFEDQKDDEANNYIAWCLLNNGEYTFKSGKTIYASECDYTEKYREEEEAEARRMAEVAEKEERYLATLEKRIEDAIGRLNDETSTLKDYGAILSQMDYYSDVYKDINCIRPHWAIGMWYAAMDNKAPKLAKVWANMTWEKRKEFY